MDEKQFQALVDKVGVDATNRIKAELANYDEKMKTFANEVYTQKGGITLEQFEAYKKTAEATVESVKAIAEKQGTTLAEVAAKLGAGEPGKVKSIAQALKEDAESLRAIYNAGSGQKTYMVTLNEKGETEIKGIDLSNTANKVGPEASIGGINGGVSAITQALDAATLLRVGAGAQINSQFRNTPWIFDLCNTINASFNSSMPFVMWFDEQPKNGSSATTAEGATKPGSQYLYQLNSATYKKEATLVGFTQEFQMDFAQLESDIMNKARIDVINRVNDAILPNIVSTATAYNSGVEYKGADPVTAVNDFDAISAMAAQVDNATFGSARANAAIMSATKKYRMGTIKNQFGSWLNAPDVLSGISLVGNRQMTALGGGADAVLVGDLKQYNIILRGGLIVRVGYNGTDFAQNAYSVVLEQFYFDYISTVRKVAIVKGPDFATVKAAISQ